eukprot:524537-Pleurochrysis_carterae.AAC.1
MEYAKKQDPRAAAMGPARKSIDAPPTPPPRRSARNSPQNARRDGLPVEGHRERDRERKVGGRDALHTAFAALHALGAVEAGRKA